MTPYTSLASSSKARPEEEFWGGVPAEEEGSKAPVEPPRRASSFMATTTPVVDANVFRGLLYADGRSEGGWGSTERETPGRRLPCAAGLGRLDRCQS